MTTSRRAVSVGLFVAFCFGLLADAQVPAPRTLEDLVSYIQAHHKAPFDREGAILPRGGAQVLMRSVLQPRAANEATAVQLSAFNGQNVKVNRDRNPWPKAEIGAAVDPTNGKNYVVMSNDFRENFDHMFYHVSTNGGLAFTDDSMVSGDDPVTGFAPMNFQSDPGVGFDRVGHSYLSTISGNLIFDFNNDYLNFDTQVEVVQGFNHGTFTSLIPTSVDDQGCNGTFEVFNCPIQLDKPLITVDDVPGSPHINTIYVYYTAFCNLPTPCTDGNVTIPGFSSVILAAHAPGAGLPFSKPALVSGGHIQTQFSDMVIDSQGTPHIFFDDFAQPTINMWESTLKAGKWVVSSKPVAQFTFNHLSNLNWNFRDDGSVAPGCGIHGDTAYCAFSANHVVGGPIEGTPSVYVAVVNTLTGASQIHRVNNDAFGNLKDHFFAWATTKADGSVYVGWYDNRNDPFNAKVEYFVGKSTDGGKTFPTQAAVSAAKFNPCVGFPGCGFFGDYTQLVSGPDGVVHAAWSDTRDGASMQIFTQAVTW
jgi:hypothetical protein